MHIDTGKIKYVHTMNACQLAKVKKKMDMVASIDHPLVKAR